MIAEDYSSGLETIPINAFSDEDRESTAITDGSELHAIPLKKSLPTNPQKSNMPVTASSQSSLSSLPSFMSVYGDNTEVHRERGADAVGSNRPANVAKRPSPSSHFSSPILRRDSTSTFESADSSPTTTISTLDSSLTEPSPSSSPESPPSSLPLSSLKPLGINMKATREMDPKDHFSSSLASLPGLHRGDSPNKKMRNTKNLSVNTSASFRQSSLLPKLALSTAVVAPSNGRPFSAPPTPLFIVPPKPARRRPSNLGLTLSTPDSNNANYQGGPNTIPQTPSDAHFRTVRYAHVTSNVPIFSPTVAPEGGMRLPPFGNSSLPSRLGKSRPALSIHQSYNDYSSSSPTTVQTLDHVQEESDYELPLSREAKSPAYPQGPVCIYDPYVFLYLEPSDMEASEFDVIFNVAREVKNPFSVVAEEDTLPRVEDATKEVTLDPSRTFFAGRDCTSEPQTAISDKSFQSTFGTLPDSPSPSNSGTAKPAKAVPEYVHVPWEHNTNVVDDLLRLCEVIDDRVRQRKKVLIHCQCGVSRSASLVVAYGLYKNPELTVQEAYNIVKSRSRWIGPNMSLIYQLSEFRSNIQRYSPPIGPGWRNPGPGWTLRDAISTVKLPSGVEASIHRNFQKGSFTRPFQDDRGSQPGRANSFTPPNSSQAIGTSAVGDVTPGPSSAPPSLIWSPGAETLRPTVATETMDENEPQRDSMQLSLPKAMDIDLDDTLPAPNVDPEPTPREAVPSVQPLEPTSLPPPPAPSFPFLRTLPNGVSSLAARRHLHRRLPLRQEPLRFTENQFPPRFGPDRTIFDLVPDTPSLLSPRAAEFTASPFHRTAAGDLAGSSIFEQGLLSPKAQNEDPRSPAQRGEAPITRSIFGVL
ncbi:hypothetical protein MMC29_007268 [Sticta canariensis]|nr:hypothetical protein [Sticta canariensis]